MSKTAWLIIAIVFFPIGTIAYFIWGRGERLPDGTVKVEVKERREPPKPPEELLPDEILCKINYGLPVSPKETVKLEVGEEALEFTAKDNTYRLPFSKIKLVTSIKETELVKKGKNMVGRAVMGGIIGGDMGALVGTATGMGTKNAKGKFILIQYLNSQEQIANLVFTPVLLLSRNLLIKKIKKAAEIGAVEL